MMNNYSGSEFERSIIKMMEEFDLGEAEEVKDQLVRYSQAAGCANLYSKLASAKKAGKLSCGANALMGDIMEVSAGQGEEKLAEYMELFGDASTHSWRKGSGPKVDIRVRAEEELDEADIIKRNRKVPFEPKRD